MLGVLRDDFRHLRCRANGNRGLRDDHEFSPHGCADGLGDVEHVAQIRGSIFVRRRADRDEHHVRLTDGPGDIRRE